MVAAAALAVAWQLQHGALPALQSTAPSLTQTVTQPVAPAPTTAPATQAPTEEADVNDDLLLLVNEEHPIPEGYHPDLVRVEGEYQTTADKRIVADLKQMMRDCRKAGYRPLICSSYRTLKKQKSLFDDRVRRCRVYEGLSEEEAKAEAAKWVATPGTSEHHTGLALDIVDNNYQLLDEGQETTGTQKWLMRHCWEYGFILRYPTDKSSVTHIHYEPWHYRYVGKENAEKIHQSGLCLEEYLQTNKYGGNSRIEGGNLPVLLCQLEAGEEMMCDGGGVNIR